ncbi:uncharacterized protein LOC123542442 [Mercenaria mercenaria]|uniref:uncharacterized protein LOC123542442 n=1 Tax=Mercenaria mercenaria TaxID=6596 RepID=UPI00234F2A80|nr:uncharacterized protein LOC123542442 [Mercenaria mercenaria]
MRLKLEARLNDAENKITQMHLFNTAVSNELEKERNELQQMKTVCNDLRLEIDNITADKSFASLQTLNSIKTDVENITDILSSLKLEDKIHHEEATQLNRTLVENISKINGQLQNANNSLNSIRAMKRHGFSVYYPDRKSGSGTTPVKFGGIFYNDFNVFNMTTGMFDCKHSGLYILTFSIVNANEIEGSVKCRVYKTGQYQCICCYSCSWWTFLFFRSELFSLSVICRRSHIYKWL